MSISVSVKTRINAPIDLVFNSLVDPDFISQWMFGPSLRPETILHIKTNPVVNGTFSFLVERNGQQLDHVGRYLTVNPPHQLTFTWAIGEIKPDDSIVKISLEPSGNSSLLKLVHEMQPEWTDYLDRTREAWQKMTGQLALILNQNSN